MGPHIADEAHQVLEGVAFDVVVGLRPLLHQRGKFVYVLGADVTLVGPRVHRDAVRSSLQAQRGRFHDAGDAQVPRVAQQRDLVDVDRQRGVATAGVWGDEGVHGRLAGLAGAVSFCTPCQTWRVRKRLPPR